MPQVIPVEARVGVARVLYPGQSGGPRLRGERIARAREKRAGEGATGERARARDRGEPVGSAAAQRLQEEGLRLVTGVLGEQEMLVPLELGGEGGVAGGAGGRLRPLPTLLDVHPVQRERHAEGFGHERRVPRPFAAVRVQAVIDVHGAQRHAIVGAEQLDRDVQQQVRVHAAAVGDAIAGDVRVPLDMAGERLERGLRDGLGAAHVATR